MALWIMVVYSLYFNACGGSSLCFNAMEVYSILSRYVQDTGNFDKTRVSNHFRENRLESLLLYFYKTTLLQTAVTENIAVELNNATELFWKAYYRYSSL